MKAKTRNREGDGDEKQPFDFLLPPFHQQQKSEYQSRMMQPTILKRLRKNKNEIMIVDIRKKQKLRWMLLCY